MSLSLSLQKNLIQQIDVVFYTYIIYFYYAHVFVWIFALAAKNNPPFLLLDADPQVFEGPTCGSAGGLVLNFDYFVAWFSVSGAFLAQISKTR